MMFPEEMRSDIDVIRKWLKMILGIEMPNTMILNHCLKKVKTIETERLTFLHSSISFRGYINGKFSIEVSEENKKKLRGIKGMLKGLNISAPFIAYLIVHERANLYRELLRVRFNP